jgi:uncharacterized protein DUF3185
MGISRIIGLTLLAIGVVLVLFGYNASQSMGEQIVEGFTGRFTNQTMWYLIGGTAAIVGGGALSIWGGRRAAS